MEGALAMRRRRAVAQTDGGESRGGTVLARGVGGRAPSTRRQPSSKCRSASIFHCRCTRSDDPIAVPLRRRGADRRPGTTARRSAAAAAHVPIGHDGGVRHWFRRSRRSLCCAGRGLLDRDDF